MDQYVLENNCWFGYEENRIRWGAAPAVHSRVLLVEVHHYRWRRNPDVIIANQGVPLLFDATSTPIISTATVLRTVLGGGATSLYLLGHKSPGPKFWRVRFPEK